MEELHEVDPRGDVIITLRNPGAPFAEATPEAVNGYEAPAIADEVLSGSELELSRKFGMLKKKKKSKRSRSCILATEICGRGFGS